MEHYAGIDVSLELSSVCIVDAKGKIVRETEKSRAIPLRSSVFSGASHSGGADRARSRTAVTMATRRIDRGRL